MNRPLQFPVAVAGAPEGEVLGFLRLLWSIDHALQVRSKEMARRLGVTGPQRLALRMLRRHSQLTAGQLAALLHVHPSTLTGILGRLERNGLVQRQVDGTDRRRCRLALTQRGRLIESARAGTVEAAVAEALDQLTPPELAAAQKALAAVANHLLPAGDPSGVR